MVPAKTILRQNLLKIIEKHILLALSYIGTVIFETLECHDFLILGKGPIKCMQRPDMAFDLDAKPQLKIYLKFMILISKTAQS